jgi:hypothetical protein
MKSQIKNRNYQTIVIETHVVEDQKGIGFVVHGLAGFKEQDQIQTFVKSL